MTIRLSPNGLDLRAANLAIRNTLGDLAPLPGGRFFTPTQDFWYFLQSFPADIQWVDCGTGSGDLIEEAITRGIDLIGIDVLPREGQSERVIVMDATRFPWAQGVCPLICRPCHNGFCSDTVKSALSKGSQFVVYVGLPKNFHRDMGGFCAKKRTKVGHDGEYAYVIENT